MIALGNELDTGTGKKKSDKEDTIKPFLELTDKLE